MYFSEYIKYYVDNTGAFTIYFVVIYLQLVEIYQASQINRHNYYCAC